MPHPLMLTLAVIVAAPVNTSSSAANPSKGAADCNMLPSTPRHPYTHPMTLTLGSITEQLIKRLSL